ncbi:MAG: transporter substrate-binding domain-containing protein [Lachnospiraceae bacterium]|nr:transporter substrate-binding domain-containing protein [Lachnospiraceae bacterium]
MKKRVIYLWSVAAAAATLLVLATAGFAKPDAKGRGITSTEELKGCVMAGVDAARLPEENAEVLFETILGTKLSGYHAVSDIDGLLYELKSGRADVICCPDVTAEYLLRTEEGLVRLQAPKDTANGTEDGGRLSFALALRSGEEALCAELNAAITELEADGGLKALHVAYVEAEIPLELYEKKQKPDKKTLYVGVTGTLPPLDRLDEDGVPCGFSVAFLEELEKRTGYRFETVVISPKDSFTLLNSGKVDLLFAYGTSRNTTPGEKDYLVTKGYYTMKEYAYLSLDSEASIKEQETEE